MQKVFRSLTIVRLLTLITFAAVFIIAVRPAFDGDLYWHLRSGQWQVEHRAILDVDLFSHSRAGGEWVNHSWLSQIILYGFYTLGGDLGASLYTALFALIGMGFVFKQSEGDPLIRAFAIILASVAAAIFWSPRPHMTSFALSGAVLYLLWLYQHKGIDRLWFIPLIMILWANLHAGFAIGFILMVLATIGEGLHWLFDGLLGDSSDGDIPSLRPVIRLVVIGLVSAAAISFNPYGPVMLLYPFQTVGIGVLQDFIQEWASPDFHNPQFWPFIWLLLGTLVAVGLSPKRLSWRDALLVGGTAYNALLAGRNIATFALVCTPVLVYHLDAWREAQGFRLNWKRLSNRKSYLIMNWLIALLIVGAGGLKIALDFSSENLDVGRRAVLPVGAAEYLNSEDLDGNLFNDYNWGGYLIWETRDLPVYVDGRTDLYDDEILRVYLSTTFARPGWEKNLDDIGINTVLIGGGSPLAYGLDDNPAWDEVYRDDLSVIFTRLDPLGH